MQNPRSYPARRCQISRVRRPALQEVPNLQDGPISVLVSIGCSRCVLSKSLYFPEIWRARHLPFAWTGDRDQSHQFPTRLWLRRNRNPKSKERLDVAGEICNQKIVDHSAGARALFQRQSGVSEVVKLFCSIPWNDPSPFTPLPVGRGEGEPANTARDFLNCRTYSCHSLRAARFARDLSHALIIQSSNKTREPFVCSLDPLIHSSAHPR